MSEHILTFINNYICRERAFWTSLGFAAKKCVRFNVSDCVRRCWGEHTAHFLVDLYMKLFQNAVVTSDIFLPKRTTLQCAINSNDLNKIHKCWDIPMLIFVTGSLRYSVSSFMQKWAVSFTEHLLLSDSALLDNLTATLSYFIYFYLFFLQLNQEPSWCLY